jgi:hypothetical protein
MPTIIDLSVKIYHEDDRGNKFVPDWPPAWHAKAACRGVGLPASEMFFSTKRDDIAKVKAFCAGCPVRHDCAKSALENDEVGWWAGSLTRSENRRNLAWASRTVT